MFPNIKPQQIIPLDESNVYINGSIVNPQRPTKVEVTSLEHCEEPPMNYNPQYIYYPQVAYMPASSFERVSP